MSLAAIPPSGKMCLVYCGPEACDCGRGIVDFPTAPKPTEPAQRKKHCYLGAPEVFSLGQICSVVSHAFGEHCCYMVGSVLERPDFRDVDVRLIMGDRKWQMLFGEGDNGEILRFWSLINTAISEYIAKRTGLRIDFQIQSMTQANGKLHGKKPRQSVGVFIDMDHEPAWSISEWSDPKVTRSDRDTSDKTE